MRTCVAVLLRKVVVVVMQVDREADTSRSCCWWWRVSSVDDGVRAPPSGVPSPSALEMPFIHTLDVVSFALCLICPAPGCDNYRSMCVENSPVGIPGAC